MGDVGDDGPDALTYSPSSAQTLNSLFPAG
jgi:hypothetical protein